ncbi:hypothetical protein [Streptomyces sp. NPDC059003]|uniref:transmembrane-type terpene cyclase n=1 Tax=Streptomyces sp. NPDC059003 TaxID=3346691 RepID=UPI00367A5979
MFATFILIAGSTFDISYVLTIRRGFLDHTYGVPLLALCAFIGWDVRNALGAYHPWIPMLGAVSGLYVVGHAVIFYQLLVYGPREFPGLSRLAFYAMVTAALGFTAFAVPAIDQSLQDTWGIHTAEGTWLAAMTSYPMLLYSRGSTRGLSIPICLLQLLTIIVASIAFLRYLPTDFDVTVSPLLRFICLGMTAANLIYLAVLLHVRKANSRDTRASGITPAAVATGSAPTSGKHLRARPGPDGMNTDEATRSHTPVPRRSRRWPR